MSGLPHKSVYAVQAGQRAAVETVPARPRRRGSSRLAARLGLLVPCALVAGLIGVLIGPYVWASLAGSVSYVFSDLDVYRIGANALVHANDLYGPLPPTHTGQLQPFTYPPFAAMALSPFALVSRPIASAAMVVLSLLALGAVIYLIVSRLWGAWPTRRRVFFTAIAVPASCLLDPVGHTLWLGQVNLLLMALVAFDCLAEKPRWPRGALVGIAAAIKLTPAAFVLFFVMTKNRRAVMTMAATFLAAELLAFAATPISSLKYWTGATHGVTSIAGSAYATNQGIRGELSRVHHISPSVQSAIWLALCVAVVGLALVGMRRMLRDDDRPFALVINAACGLLVSPVSWAHHWVYAVPALLVMAARGLRIPSKGWAVAATVAGSLFLVAPYQFLPTNSEYSYEWWQHLVGNPYGLLAVALLATVARPPMGRLRCADRSMAVPER